MKALCIDNISTFIAPMVGITIGSWYDVTEDTVSSYYFWISDDNGFHTVSLISNFKTLDQLRGERLKLLGL